MLTVHAHINSKCMCIQFLVVNKIYICCPNITFENKLLFTLKINQYCSHCRFHNNQVFWDVTLF